MSKMCESLIVSYPIGMLDRDQRTILTLQRSRKETRLDCKHASPLRKSILDICENCDKCQNINKTKKAKSYSKFMTTKFISFLIIAISIAIMSSHQAEANPIPTQAKKNNFLDLECGRSRSHTAAMPTDEKYLRERLTAVMTSCRHALYSTKDLTESYIRKLWGSNITVDDHHKTWEFHSLSWLYPENEPLKKHFREKIQSGHLHQLRTTDWTSEKIVEYLGKIYRRFQRIAIGIEIVNKWNELATEHALLDSEGLKASKNLFNKAQDEITNVLRDIHDILCDMAIDPRTDLDITPFEMEDFIKLNHWLVYREYENLMDYSHKLLNIIIGKDNRD